MAWILFAVGSPYAAEAKEIVQRCGGKVVAAIANRGRDRVPKQIDLCCEVEEIALTWFHLPVVVPLTTPGYRLIAVDEARKIGFHLFPPLIDPSAVVASSAILSEGLLINAGVVVGAGTEFKSFVSLNRSASVGHHCRLASWSTLGPGALLCGHVKLGDGAYIGAGAVVLPGVSVGQNSVVGAGAVVTKDVAQSSVVVGNPAKEIKKNVVGFQGVGV